MKFFWILRYLIYSIFLQKSEHPSYMGKPIFVRGLKKLSIEKMVRIYPHARIEIVNDGSSIIIKKNTSIGQNFHIISGLNQKLIIGESTTISANVFITNVEHQFTEINTHIMDQPLKGNHTRIGENCFIGYGAVLQAGTILGKQCIVGSNAVVRGHFPDYSVIAGMPARIIKRYNESTMNWEKTDSKGNFLT